MGRDKTAPERDSNILHHLKQHFEQVNRRLDVQDRKLNLLIENAGLGDKLRQLEQQLESATDSLQSALNKANQPPK